MYILRSGIAGSYSRIFVFNCDIYIYHIYIYIYIHIHIYTYISHIYGIYIYTIGLP